MDNLGEINRVFGTFNLPRMNQKEIYIMNNSITSTEIESVIENSAPPPKKKAQDQMAS